MNYTFNHQLINKSYKKTKKNSKNLTLQKILPKYGTWMALEWLKVFSIRCRVKRCSPSPFTEVTGRRSLRRVGVSGSPNCGQAFRGDWRNPQHNGGWVVGPNSTWKIWVKMEKNIPKIKILYIYIYFVDVISFIHIPTQNTGIKIKDSIWIFFS